MSASIAIHISRGSRWLRTQRLPLHHPVTLGSSPGCDVILEGVGVRHAFMMPVGAKVRLVAGQGHDVRIGGMPVRETLAIDRGRFEVGPYCLDFAIEADPPRPARPGSRGDPGERTVEAAPSPLAAGLSRALGPGARVEGPSEVEPAALAVEPALEPSPAGDGTLEVQFGDDPAWGAPLEGDGTLEITSEILDAVPRLAVSDATSGDASPPLAGRSGGPAGLSDEALPGAQRTHLDLELPWPADGPPVDATAEQTLADAPCSPPREAPRSALPWSVSRADRVGEGSMRRPNADARGPAGGRAEASSTRSHPAGQRPSADMDRRERRSTRPAARTRAPLVPPPRAPEPPPPAGPPSGAASAWSLPPATDAAAPAPATPPPQMAYAPPSPLEASSGPVVVPRLGWLGLLRHLAAGETFDGRPDRALWVLCASAALHAGLLLAMALTPQSEPKPLPPPPPTGIARAHFAQPPASAAPRAPTAEPTEEPVDDAAPPQPHRRRPPTPAPEPSTSAPEPARPTPTPRPSKQARKTAKAVERNRRKFTGSALLDAEVDPEQVAAAPRATRGRGRSGHLGAPTPGPVADGPPGRIGPGRRADVQPKKVERRARIERSDTPRISGGTERERAAIRDAVGARWNRFQNCYDKALFRRPQLAGRMKMSFDVSPAGAATRVQGRLEPRDDRPLVACFVRELSRITIEREDRRPISVRYTFILGGR